MDHKWYTIQNYIWRYTCHIILPTRTHNIHKTNHIPQTKQGTTHWNTSNTYIIHTLQKHHNRHTKPWAKIRQITTKLQINPSYITIPSPTPNNTKVHKQPKWSKSLYLLQLNPSNAPQLPDFPHIYQAKFLPQYYYYIDRSFTPLK